MILMPITIINLVLAILLTSVTGTIMVIFWMLVGKGLEKLGFIHIRYELLKLVSFFFLCPISYCVLKVYETEIGQGALFTPTSTIMFICSTILVIWCGGIVGFIVYMLSDIYKLHRKYRDAFPCNKSMDLQFTRLKEEMGLKDASLSMCRSYRTETPYVTGFWRARIVLPVRDYTEEELRVVLTHELTHYKQGDLRLKYFSFIVLALHFFNPLAWVLFGQIQSLSEYVCDYRACRQVGGVGKYFDLLVTMETESGTVSVISSHLFNKEIELRERVRRVKEVESIKKKPKFAVAIVLTLALIISTASVFTTTAEAAQYYVDWYGDTRVSSFLDTQTTELQAKFVPAAEVGDAITVIMEDVQMTKSVGTIVDWEVKSGYRLYTDYFKREKGDTIQVTTNASPSNVNYYIGIEYANGDQYIVQGTGALYYPFETDRAGYWRVFVENPSSQTITVAGSYVYLD